MPQPTVAELIEIESAWLVESAYRWEEFWNSLSMEQRRLYNRQDEAVRARKRVQWACDRLHRGLLIQTDPPYNYPPKRDEPKNPD